MKEPSAAPKYNIENAHRWWREQLAKFIAKDPNLKKEYQIILKATLVF